MNRPTSGRADVEGMKKDKRAKMAVALSRVRFRDRVETAAYKKFREKK